MLTGSSDPHSLLQRLLALRLLLAAACLGCAVIAEWGFDIWLPWRWMGWAALPPVMASLWAAWRLQRHDAAGRGELATQLAADSLGIALLAAATGGTTNPLLSLLLLPVAASAALLNAQLAVAVACGNVIAYAMAARFARPLNAPPDLDLMPLHLGGMAITFAFSTGLLCWLVGRLTQAVRQREQALAAAREAALRNDRLAALGTLAGGTAHALGTPLNSLVLIAEHLRTTCADSEQQQDLEDMSAQLHRCKDLIHNMLDQAGASRAGDTALPVRAWLHGFVDRWRLLHPETEISLDAATASEPVINPDDVLQQALRHLLDNAARAGGPLTIEARINGARLNLSIDDQGPGFSPAALQHASHRPWTDQPQGMGLGLFLSRAAIERCGGRMALSNRPQGGARVCLMLPLAALQEPSP